MIHNLSYRAFVHGTESEDRVREAICTLLPSANAEKEITEGYHKNKVIILSGRITRKKEINDFLEKLQSIRPSIKKKIFNQLEKRMDERGNLFLRFDKQGAYLGDLMLVEHGDAIHIKLKIAAYPARKDVALGVAQEIFKV